MEFEWRKRRHVHMNIAPLVDVVFLLLLFFMIASKIAAEPAIKVALPASRTAASSADEEIVITVGTAGAVFVGQQEVGLEGLRSALARRLAGTGRRAVKIRADREVPVGLLVSVVDEVRLAGCHAFSIVTERTEL